MNKLIKISIWIMYINSLESDESEQTKNMVGNQITTSYQVAEYLTHFFHFILAYIQTNKQTK